MKINTLGDRKQSSAWLLVMSAVGDEVIQWKIKSPTVFFYGVGRRSGEEGWRSWKVISCTRFSGRLLNPVLSKLTGSNPSRGNNHQHLSIS